MGADLFFLRYLRICKNKGQFFGGLFFFFSFLQLGLPKKYETVLRLIRDIVLRSRSIGIMGFPCGRFVVFF